ncbi:hypothetical protein AYI68_g4452 [Smittium mucronatum]|uniref:Uncharacterized protein n=1 Tax=Smittium mucronatum TaxID=133383 RepID=A0A1R0GX15_9FUNG|nr:hypothetical protein AYI68_g4452 [Smittium mucronatum]
MKKGTSSKKSKGGKAKYTSRELKQLKEYGQLDPTSLQGNENELEEAISKAINRKLGNRVGTFVSTKGNKRGLENEENTVTQNSSRFKKSFGNNEQQNKESQNTLIIEKDSNKDSYKILLDRFQKKNKIKPLEEVLDSEDSEESFNEDEEIPESEFDSEEEYYSQDDDEKIVDKLDPEIKLSEEPDSEDEFEEYLDTDANNGILYSKFINFRSIFSY